jgi:hypothetical protein
MVDVRIATSAEQPINSDGTPSTVTLAEGDLVGLNSDGDIILADAASGTAEPAVGVAAVPVDDPNNYPTGQFEYAAKTAEANRASINNEKVGYVKYGVEIVNQDADWGWTPGEPVYLASSDDSFGSGEFTTTEPAGSSEIVQAVGSVQPDGESVFLDIDPDYTTNA